MLKRRMNEEDIQLSVYLHKILDSEVDQELKLMIIRWFDSFDYTDLSKLSTMDHILRQAEAMSW